MSLYVNTLPELNSDRLLAWSEGALDSVGVMWTLIGPRSRDLGPAIDCSQPLVLRVALGPVIVTILACGVPERA
jgi:hypothetical protein